MQSICVPHDCVGIVFEGYSPLGNPGNPFVEVPRILDDSVVKDIATKHQATPAQVSCYDNRHNNML